MSTEVVEEKQIAKSEGTRLMTTPVGDVCIFNTELVNHKIINIINALIENGGFEVHGHGLLSIVFRNDGYPASKEVGGRNNWMFYPDSMSAVCNLQDCIDMAFDITQDAEKEHTEHVSVFFQTWKNIIQGCAHELHHAEAFIGDDDLRTNKDTQAEEELLAQEYSRKMLFEMGKTIDIEPELPVWLIGEINARLDEQFTLIEEMHKDLGKDEVDQKLSDWALCQKYLRDSGAAFYDPNEEDGQPPILQKTFKEFLHVCSGDAEDSKDWATPTIGVTVGLVQKPVNETATGAEATVAPFEPDDEMGDPDDDIVTGFAGVQIVADQLKPAANPAFVQPNNKPAVVNVASNMNTPVGAGQPVAPVPVVGAQENPAVVMGAKAYQAMVFPANVDPQTVLYGLYLKIFTHIFQTCQYNPTDPAIPFAAAGNIAAWVPLDQYEAMFIKEMTCYSTDGEGTWCPCTPVNGAISGLLIDKAKLLPAYELTLSTPDGTQVKRKFIPQNPNKVKAGAPTATALLAKQGNQIMWIIDPDTKAYNIRVYNGVIQNNINGVWQ